MNTSAGRNVKLHVFAISRREALVICRRVASQRDTLETGEIYYASEAALMKHL